MKETNEIFAFLPDKIARILENQPQDLLNCLEEISLKPKGYLYIITDRETYFFTKDGKLSNSPSGGYVVSEEEISEAVGKITGGSYYSLQEEIKEGFVTVRGGHRIGISGKAAFMEDKIISISDIASLNYRVAREVKGSADPVIHAILHQNKIYNTLIISPPRCGKTTLLRDLARQLSNGIDAMHFKGIKVSISDERNEIAACVSGIPQHDVGVKTDVMYNMNKADAMMMLIRSMSPQVLITDEIGTDKDVSAIHSALSAGVSIIASIHGESLADVALRKNVYELIENKVFQRIIILSCEDGKRTIKKIINNEG